MAEYHYQCKKCWSIIEDSSTPSSAHCPEGSSHSWYKLATVGYTYYQCKKCGTTIQAKAMPTSLHCPASGNHQWHKL